MKIVGGRGDEARGANRCCDVPCIKSVKTVLLNMLEGFISKR